MNAISKVFICSLNAFLQCGCVAHTHNLLHPAHNGVMRGEGWRCLRPCPRLGPLCIAYFVPCVCVMCVCVCPQFVVKRDGKQEIVQFDKISVRIERLCCGLAGVDALVVAQKVVAGVFSGVHTSRLDELAAETGWCGDIVCTCERSWQARGMHGTCLPILMLNCSRGDGLGASGLFGTGSPHCRVKPSQDHPGQLLGRVCGHAGPRAPYHRGACAAAV